MSHSEPILDTEVLDVTGDGAVLVSREAVRAGISHTEILFAGRFDEMISNLAGLVTDTHATGPALSVRCDRCRTHAAAEFDLGARTPLAFCGHHVRAYLKGLCKAGASPQSVDPKRIWFLNLPDIED